jgi:hypothetical protein
MKKLTVMQVYREVLREGNIWKERAWDREHYTIAEQEQAEAVSRAYWNVAGLLELTEEINPTKHG